MSAPLPTSGAHPELRTWQELEDVLARLSHLARTSVAPPEFYRSVLDQSVLALSADGGAVWLRTTSGAAQLLAQTGHAAAHKSPGEAEQLVHQTLLARVAAGGIVVTIAPQIASDKSVPLNLTDH